MRRWESDWLGTTIPLSKHIVCLMAVSSVPWTLLILVYSYLSMRWIHHLFVAVAFIFLLQWLGGRVVAPPAWAPRESGREWGGRWTT